jgi:hypothetical protein
MSTGIASLHKVLKDETRRKIILLLCEKESLSYVDLMKELQVTSTGKMNYHLKILNDLLAKNEAGQYTLTEKGKLASRLLLEFPEKNRIGKPKWWRRFWLESLIFVVAFVAIFSAAYILGYINSYNLYRNLISIAFVIGFSYMIQLSTAPFRLSISVCAFLIKSPMVSLVGTAAPNESAKAFR